MTIFQAIILGTVQGFTEFLPISSSAHLYLLPYFFDWDYQGLGFDVALHWGTLLSVLLIFRKDYWKYLRAVCPYSHQGRGSSFLFVGDDQGEEADKSMAWYLVLGSIPAALIGFLLKDQAESLFRSPWVIFVTLTAFALLLWVSDKKIEVGSSDSEARINWKKVLFIGAAQAVAIIPGVSRSGATITAGMFASLSRRQAARFSFLLSGPIIFGAGLVSIPDLGGITPPLIFGFIASAISGFIAIRFLLKFISNHSFNTFVYYRYALALVVLVILLIR